MKRIIVSQRVDIVERYGERRDAIDQKWYELCEEIGVSILPAPNNPKMLLELLSNIQIDGVLLTGGNSPVKYGGTSSERDYTDNTLIAFASDSDLPLLGVCRGCQSIALYFGVTLQKVDNHISVYHHITGEVNREVNSFHNYAIRELPTGFMGVATSGDGVIEALRYKNMLGIMWHPERESPFADADIALLKKHFGV